MIGECFGMLEVVAVDGRVSVADLASFFNLNRATVHRVVRREIYAE